ncbi:MAG: hypothetical protein U5L04_00800 [Trueperaceae bacterium]|nr:hypothetical protein [Trueperaceae bacterium]
MSCWIGFYYIPPEGPFYDLGSQILRYDIRAERTAPLSDVVRAKIGAVPSGWIRDARHFGFHLTVGEALRVSSHDLPRIEDELAALLGCLHPDSRLTLHYQGLRRWRDDKVWVLRYRASEALGILQAVVVARLARYARHSHFIDAVRDNPNRYPDDYQRQRIETFLTPRGFDTWEPHFTLLNPYEGNEPERLAERLEPLFRPVRVLECESFCLVEKRDDGPWRIRRELTRPA